MKNFKLALVASVVALSASGVAVAAQDGTLGLTSTGESVVTIIKENAVQISNVDDVDLGTQATLAADAVGGDDVCVFASTGGYDITVSGAGTAFELTGTGGTIPYAVTWAANGGAAAAVTFGTTITGLAGDTDSLTCAGGTNARFEVTVAAAAFNAADPGTYTDTLTLFVEPE